jgi:3-phosphoglycerate kinase
MGYSESEQFQAGTIALSDFLSSLTSQGVTTILCGGDTVSSLTISSVFC